MIDVSGFYNFVNDYIFISPTNETLESTDIIYRYSQINAKLYGAEIFVDYLPFDWFNIKSSYSYLIGEQDNGDNLPFIPQNKLRFDLKFQKKNIAFLKKTYLRIGGLYASKQNNPSMFESKSDDYVLLNAGIGTQIKCSNQNFDIAIYADNLLNKTYIDHLSTLKPLGYSNIGRNFSISLKIPFGIN
jgi:iron complex outermembrane receptor protein